MIITGHKAPLVEPNDDLFMVLSKTLLDVKDKSIIIVSSKIVSLCQGQVVPLDTNKRQLIASECEWYLPADSNPFNSTITITGHKLAAAAGIDESNAHNCFVLLPKNTKKVAQQIRQWAIDTFTIIDVGVVIIDSRSIPLNLGTVGQALAYDGIQPLKDYRGTNDLFGREILVSRLSTINCLASAAILVMGEGTEQMPVAVITDTNISFTDTVTEPLDYPLDQDLYSQLLKSEKWIKGGGNYLSRQTS